MIVNAWLYSCIRIEKNETNVACEIIKGCKARHHAQVNAMSFRAQPPFGHGSNGGWVGLYFCTMCHLKCAMKCAWLIIIKTAKHVHTPILHLPRQPLVHVHHVSLPHPSHDDDDDDVCDSVVCCVCVAPVSVLAWLGRQ